MSHAVPMKFCLLLFAALTARVYAQDWTWAGFEVLGHHSTPRERILQQIPIAVGEKYREDVVAWQTWCTRLTSALSLTYAHCSGVRFADFKAYFVVDIVEKGQEHRARFRAAPTADIALATPQVMAVYEKLQTRLWELFSQGKPPQEKWDKGYLDYSDSGMHARVLELIKMVPQHRKNILKVLSEDSHPERRMAAADLLNWTLKGPELVVQTLPLLDDPHSGVRNQLSRFMMHFVARVKSTRELRRAIDALLIQADRPSHGDRNKALFNLVEILRVRPDLGPYVKANGLPLIRYIADKSILTNVGGPAKDLLSMTERFL